MSAQECEISHLNLRLWLVSVGPTKRWRHAMCLSDPDTAVLIGGETSEQNYCEDALWKLELGQWARWAVKTSDLTCITCNCISLWFSDSDFWFPMNSTASGPVPPCARGHTATYDPDSKVVYVYGGLREGPSDSEVYIMNTLTWKWTLVTVGLFKYMKLILLSVLLWHFFCFQSSQL